MSLNAKVHSLEALLSTYPLLDVPNYQRSYKWDLAFVDKFFNDTLLGLEHIKDGDGRGHFLGSIVVCKREEDGGWDLVDGQQRLTSLTLMMWSLAKLASKATYARARQHIMDEKGLKARIQHKAENREFCSDRDAYLEIATKNEPNFTRYEGDSDKTLEMNSKWRDALKSHLITKVAARLDALARRESGVIKAARKLKNLETAADHLYRRLAEDIRLICIETDRRKEGLRVFASLNAGGTKLEPWELIMSAFYTHGPSAAQQRATQLVFEHDKLSITKQLGSKDVDIGVNAGLRTYWLATRRIVRMDDLFEDFNNELANSPNTDLTHKQMLQEIMELVPILKGLNTAEANAYLPNHGTSPIDLRPTFPLCIAFGDRISKCVLLATVNTLRKQGRIEEANEAVAKVAFAMERARMQISACRLMANFIDEPYSRMAVAINSGKAGKTADSIEDFVYRGLREIDGFADQEALELALRKFNPNSSKDMANVVASRLQFALRNPKRPGNWYMNVPVKDDRDFGGVPALNIKLKDIDEADARKMGFSSLARLIELHKSLGNILATTTPTDGAPDMSLELNKGVNLSKLDEEGLANRRDELAELARKIWGF